jgi:CheY-like chemotaxis protein
LKPLLFLVEDNPDVLYNLKLTLEFNDYEVQTAKDGIEAVEKLGSFEKLPDLIISDIMMPRMNGYDFFKSVSENPSWSTIPFIFLTARTSPKDIRFGKMLGVDDYIIKPFKEADLLASIAGKIRRNRYATSINQKVDAFFSNYQIKAKPSISEDEKGSILLLYVLWDDKSGPTLRKHYPEDAQLPIPPNDVGFQLFSGAVSIYGQTSIQNAHGILLNIQNIEQKGYIYFDAIVDAQARGRERPFMLAIIAPKINYFESLKMRVILQEAAEKIKRGEKWEPRVYWAKITDILTRPMI